MNCFVSNVIVCKIRLLRNERKTFAYNNDHHLFKFVAIYGKKQEVYVKIISLTIDT